MRNILIILTILIVYSCKKECSNYTQNVFKGKLKTIQDDMIGDSIIPTFYLFYDTVSGNLKEVKINGKIDGRDTLGTVFKVDRNVDGNIYLRGYSQYGKLVKIKTIGKQIEKIYLVDTITNNEEEITSAIINNNLADTINDVGYVTIYASNISNYDFKYQNNNCTSYTTTWIQSITGFPINQRIDYRIYYNNLPNKNVLKYQDPVGFGKPCSFIGFLNFLNLDGYYLIKPNQNLIDSVVQTPNITQKYFYEFDENDNVISVRINNRNGTNSEDRYQHMTYY